MSRRIDRCFYCFQFKYIINNDYCRDCARVFELSADLTPMITDEELQKLVSDFPAFIEEIKTLEEMNKK